MRILGIDPGSRVTGYGCVDVIGRSLQHVAHGALCVANTSGQAVVPLEDRLLAIFQGLSALVLKLQPKVMVVESVFFAKNAVSALKLGHARGVTILAGKIHALEIVEYSPTQVKMVLVGHGHADKEQVAKMVQVLIGRQSFTSNDASDGLALAICHAHAALLNNSAFTLQKLREKRKKRHASLAETLDAKVKEQLQFGSHFPSRSLAKKDRSS